MYILKDVSREAENDHWSHNVPTQIFQSVKILLAAALSSLFILASPLSWESFSISKARSSSVKNLAVSGQSTIQNFDMTPTATVSRPSRIKIHLHLPGQCIRDRNLGWTYALVTANTIHFRNCIGKKLLLLGRTLTFSSAALTPEKAPAMILALKNKLNLH
jgi:hypothetical protein